VTPVYREPSAQRSMYTHQSPAAGAVLCFTVLHLFSRELLSSMDIFALKQQ